MVTTALILLFVHFGLTGTDTMVTFKVLCWVFSLISKISTHLFAA